VTGFRRLLRGRAALAAATVAGYLVRLGRPLPGLAGAAAISVGTGMIYLPAGIIMGGLFGLMLDWRT
jgi:hypothetical protein